MDDLVVVWRWRFFAVAEHAGGFFFHGGGAVVELQAGMVGDA